MLHPDDATDRREPQDHIPPGARSPHPYRRQSLDIPDRLFVTNLAARDRQQVNAQDGVRIPRVARNESDISDYFSQGRRARRATLSTSPSDSGTEADDEKPYLKGLPPARGKIRKGLKGTSGAVTPSDFDGIHETLLADGQNRAGHSSDASSRPAAVLSQEQIERYSGKWRSELLRRILEVCFVCGLTYFTLTREADRYPHRQLDAQEQEDRYTLWAAARLCVAFMVLPTLYAALLIYRHLRAMGDKTSNTLREVPLPSDPAHFLYPSLVPLCIAAYTTTWWESRSDVLRANVILGVTSCWSSSHSFPFLNGERGAELQWLSVAVAATYLPFHPYSWQLHVDDDFMFLFPLLASLAPTLQYFCGSSLLPAETKLLSIGLINLYCFASAPQTVILQSLLWVGGVCLLVSCRHVMKWSTMLARIPGWRFRSPRHANAPTRNVASPSAIATILQSSSFRPEQKIHESSDEKDWVIDDFGDQAGNQTGSSTIAKPSVLSRGQHNAAQGSSFSRPSQTFTNMPPRQPTFSVSDPRSTGQQMPERSHAKKKQKRRAFLWLTRTQASMLKWLYAAHCYIMVVAIVFIPVRWYIQTHAFEDTEPVGWALSYLFGNLRPFRLHVVLSELESWIPLPPRPQIVNFPQASMVDFHRHFTFGAANTRLGIAAWCVLNLTLGIAAVLQLRTLVEVDTRRKVFHGMMVSMFLPTVFIDPCFIALALTLMLVIFLLLDLFRAAQLPPISNPLTHFLAPYVDGRDHKGPIVISPIFLLIGCAIPLWLSLASLPRGSTIVQDPDHPWFAWELPKRDLGMVAGVICVGMGDAAASLIGRRYGRRRWVWSGGKSLEGSAAFVIAVVIGLSAAELWRRIGGWQNFYSEHERNGSSWPYNESLYAFLAKATLAGTGASFTEAVLTGGNDNVIVPVVLWLLVRLLRI